MYARITATTATTPAVATVETTTTVTTVTTTTYAPSQGVRPNAQYSVQQPSIYGGHVPVGTGRQHPEVCANTSNVGNQVLVLERGGATMVRPQPRVGVVYNVPARRSPPTPPSVVESTTVVYQATVQTQQPQLTQQQQPSVYSRGGSARQIPGADVRRRY